MAGNWRKQLPKAPLIRFEWWPRWRSIYMFRLANVRQIHIGPLMVMVRAPWLEHAARAHYPQLFDDPSALTRSTIKNETRHD